MKRQLKQTAAIILAAAMVMSGVSIGAAADPVVAEAGPQPEMYLKFDGNAQDASGNGYTLTGRGAASGISYINGVNGQALQLKGQCFLEVNEAVTLGAGDYTFSFWLKDYGTPKWTYVMGNQNYGKADSEPGTGVIFNAPDDMYLDIAYGSDTFRTAQSLSIKDQWVHVAYSVDRDGKIVLYQNGRKITEYDCPADAQNFDVNSAGLAFMIGAGTDSANHSYFAAENNFALDEVKIYKSALSADDVQAEYASSAYLAQDYELRLTFDDENAADQSGNGYDFTDKGTTHVTYEKGINGGKAARFTGDSYMGLSAGKNLLLGTGDYSFFLDQG